MPRRKRLRFMPMTTVTGRLTLICYIVANLSLHMCAKASARICMYRLNELGDCFLLTFTSDAASSRLLIDCGSFRNGGDSIVRLKTITAKIKEALNGKPLDVVVGTHQHNDHLSG